MKYERFEDLPVWKVSQELAREIYSVTRDAYLKQPGDLTRKPLAADSWLGRSLAKLRKKGPEAPDRESPQGIRVRAKHKGFQKKLDETMAEIRAEGSSFRRRDQ